MPGYWEQKVLKGEAGYGVKEAYDRLNSVDPLVGSSHAGGATGPKSGRGG